LKPATIEEEAEQRERDESDAAAKLQRVWQGKDIVAVRDDDGHGDQYANQRLTRDESGGKEHAALVFSLARVAVRPVRRAPHPEYRHGQLERQVDADCGD
jgi:hypothetical protein